MGAAALLFEFACADVGRLRRGSGCNHCQFRALLIYAVLRAVHFAHHFGKCGDLWRAVTAAGIGLHEAAVNGAINLGGCKNEPMVGRFEAALLCQVRVTGVDGEGHAGPVSGVALGLSLAELLQGFEDAVAEAGFLDLDVAERGFVLDAGVGLNHGGAESGALNRIDRGRELFELSEREDIEFGLAGAFETPLGGADGVGKHVFDGAAGGEFGEELGAEGVVSSMVLTGEDEELAGEAVADGVEGGSVLAIGGAGSGGELRVFLVG